MAITGLYKVDYRIVVACRDGNIYTIKGGAKPATVLGTVIELESQPCAVVRVEKSIIVACMDKVVHSFHIKGKKQYSTYLPGKVTNLEAVQVQRVRIFSGYLVAIAPSDDSFHSSSAAMVTEVRLYNDKGTLVHTLPMGGNIVTAMRFGPFHRESNTLVLACKTGSLLFKILRRKASLEVSSGAPGAPAEQDVPLQVPKKTKLLNM